MKLKYYLKKKCWRLDISNNKLNTKIKNNAELSPEKRKDKFKYLILRSITLSWFVH